MKTILKLAARIISGFLLFITAYLLAAYILSRITIAEEAAAARDIAIYIKTNGVHTDIVVPVKSEVTDWSTQILFGNTVSKDSNYRYVAMGWGDKGFYLETPTWDDLTFSTAFKAAFALSTSAMHTTFYKTLKEDASCKKIMISKGQYERLVDYMRESFDKNPQGNFIYINTNANYGSTDAFYEGTGSYHLFKTCNTWANDALKASGQRCCVWTIFDTGIFLKYTH
ncbi:TIGR02117 family protein [Panacibacter sp. DH6]|uniref:TIGR02117 family protein n=1 Tax=Panacibacter microcysteis TaxID=2793269 RepID=A0A931MCB7_9BACT|nr:TIGR02117 family protein [Panacibacter microcysteis]MBG9377992.1 TIGR02117 family protein [Panacibacter microcysteis]